MANTISHWKEFYQFNAEAYFAGKTLSVLSFRYFEKSGKYEVSLLITQDTTNYEMNDNVGDPDDAMKTISFWTEDPIVEELSKGQIVNISDVNAYQKGYDLIISSAVITPAD